MTKSDELLNALAKAVKAGGGIHSATELAFMMGVPCDPAFRKFLGRVDLCCTNFTQQYIGSHIKANASDTILA